MNEQIISFGDNNQLHGIMTQPAQVEPERPIVIFWNAGLVHKFGVHRIHVHMARELAEKGFSSIRFDMAGLGDSPNSQNNATYEENAILNIQQAIDYASHENGSAKAILIGFCSGALNAHDAMASDSRISGAVMIDGYAYRTARFYLHFVFKMLTSGKAIGAFIRRLKRVFQPTLSGESCLPVEWDFPAKHKVTQELRSFIERGVKLYFIYTSDMPKHYNYKNQFYSMFSGLNFQELLTLDYYPHTDHLFTPLGQKNRLKEGIMKWIEGNFS